MNKTILDAKLIDGKIFVNVEQLVNFMNETADNNKFLLWDSREGSALRQFAYLLKEKCR